MIGHIKPDWPDLPKHIHAMTTLRSGGVSLAPFDDGSGTGVGGFNVATYVGDQLAQVDENRSNLKSMLPSDPAWLTQVHGTHIIDAEKYTGLVEADASFTKKAGIVCAVQTADCLPVLLCDLEGTVVAAVHAGWRGLCDGIIEQAILAMRGIGAGEISAWLGPAIGPQQFEVGGDVLAQFVLHDAKAVEAFTAISDMPNQYLANMYTLARQRLQSVGVARIHGGNFCTVTDVKRFYSYRRDKVTGRMASLIWMNP